MSALSLTSDILRKIFLLVQTFPYDVGQHALPVPVIISHVVRQWRTLAIDTPLLWFNIRITRHTNLDALRETILRSGECKLWVNITLPRPTTKRIPSRRLRESSHICDVLRLLMPHASRWRHLSVVAESHSIEHILQLFAGTKFTRLQSLELVKTDGATVSHCGPLIFDPNIFLTLRLHRVTIHVGHPTQLGGLTTVEISHTSCCMIDQVSLDSLSLFNSLTHPPSMLNLRKLTVAAQNPTFPLHPSFHSSSLVCLKLSAFSSTSPTLHAAFIQFFNASSSPNLKHLELDSMLGSAWDAFIQSLTSTHIPKYPALESLTLRSLQLRDADVDLEFAHAFPAITHLHLFEVDPEPVFVLLQTNHMVWPALTLTVDGTEIST
ncbi:hypothetical protein Hypma_004422 [Hypsizygus marmoreus]|uniref:F-box domain-containing protein n=1 Tax=Hypsizygus marmoreus TaxID=39966 RepID=A0A369K6B6_HYPMA|nr:hypothetical protein Hypma_004422 [Hypsizygus marmoreus]